MNRDPQIESLIKLAGERDQPSAEAFEKARAAALRSWQCALDRNQAARGRGSRPRPAVFGWSVAAGIATIAAAAFWFWTPQQAAVDVARVSVIQGDARLMESGNAIATSAVLRSRDVLVTRDGRVALAVGDALSLRVDRDTRLRLDAPGLVTLLQGAVYVDSGGLNAHTGLRIATPAGDVSHVGTQFQVVVGAGLTRVQVREGRVVLARAGGLVLDLGAGDLAEVSGSKVRVDHDLPTHGASWDWATITAPAFDIENRPLSEFLAWLAREHGWQLRYADRATQSRVQDIRLHGAMSGLDSRGMLERASLITGVPLVVSDGSLLVGARP